MSKENKEEQKTSKLSQEKVLELLKEAKEKGNITYADLANKLGDISIDEINKVYDAFDEVKKRESVCDCLTAFAQRKRCVLAQT